MPDKQESDTKREVQDKTKPSSETNTETDFAPAGEHPHRGSGQQLPKDGVVTGDKSGNK